MASLYPRNNLLWIKYRAADGSVIRESTGYRVGIGAEVRKAEILAAEKTLEEKKSRPAKRRSAEAWDQWVPEFIRRKLKGRTQERYLSAWRSVRMFLLDHQVYLPRQLSFQHCDGYIEWRIKPDLSRGKYSCGVNTAILEFKMLRWLMKYAVQCGFSQVNPAREVTVKRAPRKLFATLTAGELQQLFEFVSAEPEPWRTALQRSLALSWYHAVRLNETNVNPIKDVRLYQRSGVAAGEITFRQKGGKVRTKPLHPDLIPLFTRLREAKQERTYPVVRWGNKWTKIFIRSGIKDNKPTACFHSVRKTVQNILRRAGVAEEVVMEYVTHDRRGRTEQSEVHDSYNEITLDEMRACHAPLTQVWQPHLYLSGDTLPPERTSDSPA